jgi:hypothetical protein
VKKVRQPNSAGFIGGAESSEVKDSAQPKPKKRSSKKAEESVAHEAEAVVAEPVAESDVTEAVVESTEEKPAEAESF